MTTEITHTHSYSSSVKHAEGFPSRAVWKRRQTSCPFHVEGELPSLSRCVGRALAWGSLGATCKLRRQAPAHVTERSTRGGGFVSPAARSWGPGRTVGVSLQAGSLASRRGGRWAFALTLESPCGPGAPAPAPHPCLRAPPGALCTHRGARSPGPSLSSGCWRLWGKTAQRPAWTCFSSAWLDGASPGIADPQGTLLWPPPRHPLPAVSLCLSPLGRGPRMSLQVPPRLPQAPGLQTPARPPRWPVSGLYLDDIISQELPGSRTGTDCLSWSKSPF